MSYFLKTTDAENAKGQLKQAYDLLTTMFQMVPKIFIAQSIRPDLLEVIANYVNRLMIEDHALPRSTKELIAAHVSKLNACSYWVDAHSAMAMAQGFTREQVQSILKDVDGSTLIDDKTKKLLHFAELINRESNQVHEGTIEKLRDQGCTDEEIFEAVAVTSLFNYMDRMADALGAPVEGFQDTIEQMMNQ